MNQKTALRLIVLVATLLPALARDVAGQGLTVTPASPTMVVGQTQQFTVPGVSNAADVTAGDYHVCVLLQNGAVRCMGNNSAGQLGDGTITDSSTPVTVLQITQAVGVTTGGFHSCAVLADGRVQCWGMNEVGQLGDGTTTATSTPVTVSGITTATAVAAGYKHSCALLQSGTVKCWGDNSYGELGDGNAILSPQRGGPSTSHSSVPVTVAGITTAVAVTASDGYHSCAVLQSGSMKCWGDNVSGQLGDGTRSTAVVPVSVVGISTAVGVSSGDFHTCAVLGNRSVMCWGLNYSGQLGDGTGWDSNTPVLVSGISTATAVSVGVIHTCAVLQDGTARCWGYNSNGQVGDGTTTNRFAPAAVNGVTTAIGAVAAGNNDSCVVLQGGVVKCWGMNTYGELGIGTTADTGAPTTVTGINATWTSSDPSVATITAGGLATANNAGSTTITATFNGQSGSTTLSVAGRPVLSVVSNANGVVTSSPSGINCGSTCSAAFDSGTVITLTAAPASGSLFTGWSGCDSFSGTTCTITLTATRSVTAGFVVPTVTVTKAGNGQGSVTPSVAGLICGPADNVCVASYAAGTALNLTAAPVTGSRFVSWSGCDSTNAAVCGLTMSASKSVVPTFRLQFVLTVNKTGMGSGTVTSSPSGINCGSNCSAAYDSDTVLTLTATPGMLSIFNGWTGCDSVNGAACTVKMIAAKTVSADFIGVPFP